MKDKIFVALSTFAAEDSRPLDLLKSSGYDYSINMSGKRISPQEILRDAADATVILAGVEPYDSETIMQLQSLRCISRCGVGVDSINLGVAKSRGIVVTNTPTIPIDAVAELALTMFLALSRNIRVQSNLVQARRWERLSTHLLSGRTVGIIGLGRIGQRVAQLCQAFNAKVIAYDPMVDNSRVKQLGEILVTKEKLLKESDIISLHASKNDDQPIILGVKEFFIMKKGVLIVNLARGEMIDENALIDSLKSGHVAGAGLDVFSKEPYIGPLCDFEQVILTPHTATLAVETRVAMEMQCLENALDFLKGSVSPDRQVI